MMKKLLLIALFFAASPLVCAAATATLVSKPATVEEGSSVSVVVLVDSTLSLNTFSGTLLYPSDLLSFTGSSDGNSIISLWLAHPAAQNGGVTFAGGTPGGFAGRGGKLFSATFVAKKSGTASVSLNTIEFLRNDGAGTKEPTTAVPIAITITKKAPTPVATSTPSSPSSNIPAPPQELGDTQPPQDITAAVGRGSDLFGGALYVVFVASDKESGIDHYEVAERRFPSEPLQWEHAESPFRLSDQYETSDIVIKAVDRAGNERTTTLTRAQYFRPYELGGLAVVLILAAYLFLQRRVRKPHHAHH